MDLGFWRSVTQAPTVLLLQSPPPPLKGSQKLLLRDTGRTSAGESLRPSLGLEEGSVTSSLCAWLGHGHCPFFPLLTSPAPLWRLREATGSPGGFRVLRMQFTVWVWGRQERSRNTVSGLVLSLPLCVLAWPHRLSRWVDRRAPLPLHPSLLFDPVPKYR